MKLENIKPNKSLNKAYFKQSLKREDIELFKKNLIRLFKRINDSESEEHNKNIVSDFLKDTYYKTDYEINTSGRKDLVIHNGRTSNEPVAVIIETKKPEDKIGMINQAKPNAKAMQEIIHYYLQERYIKENKEIKHLIITDIYQWYIFDASEFERIFFNNKPFVKKYQDWNSGISLSKNTDWFYQEIAKPFLETEVEQIECTFFNLHEYEQIIKNEDKEDDTKLIDLYKILSPKHLLKLPHSNDSNELNKDFYNELLHLIGLFEHKEGSKKIIDRLPDNLRNKGSLIENTISILKTYNKLNNIERLNQYGQDEEEQLFSISLELCITWLNRILFLKLLEGQLLKYNFQNSDYSFLNIDKIKDFDELSELFFDVLAIKTKERTQDIKEKYSSIPYLNSSLFEQTELEKQTICINQLKDRFEIPLFSSTVLKDTTGKRQTSQKPVLKYLLEFLDSFNFASESTASIQEQNKSIINASVLGLIFEKINGYKDGSFFTPGFITMYMCRSAIRKAVLNKFNASFQFNCPDFESLTNYLTDVNQLKEYNEVINSIRLCDPAVGSGHFLVSALNEIIAIKSDLSILCDQQFKRLKFYVATVENDELIITDEDDKLFEYNQKNKESQRIQETLFHEKQTIIENCLFGVDINPKSVHICRLRLWIELLKNSYYTKESNFTELETLPNIDINIKCGNSLISLFALNGAGLKNGQLQKMQLATQKYKDQVIIYKSTQDKKVKKNAEKEIAKLKQEFAKIVNPKDKDYIELQKIESELANQTMQFSREDVENWKIRTNELTIKKGQLQSKYDEKLNLIYGNSFEWRFEFPEVLDESGNFLGFDVIIGNPPYISHDKIVEKEYLKSSYMCYEPFADLYCYFYEQTIKIAKKTGISSLITSNSFLKASYGKSLRNYLHQNSDILTIINIEDSQIFEEATVNTVIIENLKEKQNKIAYIVNDSFNPTINFNQFVHDSHFLYNQKHFETFSWNLIKPEKVLLFDKIQTKGHKLKDLDVQINLGIATGNNDVFVINSQVKQQLIDKDPKNSEIIKPILKGRDIHKYYYNFNDNYIILTRNEIDVKKDYPEIYNYLNSFDDKFKNRGAKGKHWTNLRACSFFDDFKKEKLIWIELSDDNRFAICNDEFFLLNSAYFLIPPSNINSLFLLGILNSKVIKFFLNSIANTSGVGTTRWINAYVKEFPIPIVTESKQKPIIKLVEKIIKEKKVESLGDTIGYERQIDELVYNLFELAPDEIKIIENE